MYNKCFLMITSLALNNNYEIFHFTYIANYQHTEITTFCIRGIVFAYREKNEITVSFFPEQQKCDLLLLLFPAKGGPCLFFSNFLYQEGERMKGEWSIVSINCSNIAILKIQCNFQDVKVYSHNNIPFVFYILFYIQLKCSEVIQH